MSASKNIVLLPGDGIGPEITSSAVGVLNLLGDFAFDERLMGGCSIDESG
ncbi:MAG: isocitrate/isopropylmalate family dehydrogenase, partial [Solirubrobacterales bacterium]|nr:isocitrate/isopropylmalate family dehydrogenase [Solirubrobacterales bacterium]